MSDNPRQQRGLIIAATCQLKQKGKQWIVPSQSGNGKYYVVPDKNEPHCTCPDHMEEGHKCKHIFAVEIVTQRELFPDGSEVETRSVTMTETVVRKPTYRQDWAAYNAAQTGEKAAFQTLLRDLCKDIPDRPKTNGRQWLPLRDMVFSAVFKVCCGMSARRFMSDLKEAHAKGYIDKLPCHNSVLGVFESPDVLPILKALVERSATPLKALESKFACDSTGFSACRFDKWTDYKYGNRTIRAWVKAHIMTGTKTNCVTAVEIHGQNAGDCVQLPALLGTTVQQFNVEEVSADLAYSTEDNIYTVAGAHAAPLIPFKRTASPAKGGLWAKMLHYFQFKRDEFLAVSFTIERGKHFQRRQAEVRGQPEEQDRRGDEKRDSGQVHLPEHLLLHSGDARIGNRSDLLGRIASCPTSHGELGLIGQSRKWVHGLTLPPVSSSNRSSHVAVETSCNATVREGETLPKQIDSTGGGTATAAGRVGNLDYSSGISPGGFSRIGINTRLELDEALMSAGSTRRWSAAYGCSGLKVMTPFSKTNPYRSRLPSSQGRHSTPVDSIGQWA